MKRKAYFLAETLMGMTLQAILALSLMGAFYMLMTFSSSLSQTLEGFDRGQMVISYVDNRIRNAGLGLWKCNYVGGGATSPSPSGVAEAFDIASNWGALNKDYLHFPVAVTSQTGSGLERLSRDAGKRYYDGNILTLLCAHKDTEKPDELLVIYSKSADAVFIPAKASSPDFQFINAGYNYKTATNFSFTGGASNLKSWGVMEASGLPVMVSNFTDIAYYTFTLTAPHKHSVKVYPMSELLNLELKRMLVAADTSGVRNFTIYDIKDNIKDGFDTAHPHYLAQNILEVYFRLDTQPETPLLDMKVLVNDGERESGDAECPPEWPSGYWQSSFGKYNFHIEQAQWRLYNLTGWVFP